MRSLGLRTHGRCPSLPHGGSSRLAARMAHAPDRPPERQLPLTTLRTAFSKRSANPAVPARSGRPLHVPEYSPWLPETTARHAPFHRSGDFAADHAPLASVRFSASTRVHVPVTVAPVESGSPVHVPISRIVLPDVALHVPDRLAWRWTAGSRRTASCAFDAPSAVTTSMQRRKNDFTEAWTRAVDRRANLTVSARSRHSRGADTHTPARSRHMDGRCHSYGHRDGLYASQLPLEGPDARYAPCLYQAR